MPLLHQQTAVAWMSPVLDAIWVASDPKLVYNNRYDWSESARNSSHLKIKRAVLKPAYWQLKWTKFSKDHSRLLPHGSVCLQPLGLAILTHQPVLMQAVWQGELSGDTWHAGNKPKGGMLALDMGTGASHAAGVSHRSQIQLHHNRVL